jgi:basic membrane protein A
MRQRFVAVSTLLVLLLVAAACGSSNDNTSGGSSSGGSKQIRVGMALPGPKNDKGFNQAHYEGILAAEKSLNVKGTVVDNVVDPQARIDALKNLAASNQLVIGVGGEFAPAGTTVAPQFPDVEFAIINGQTSDASNLHVYFVRQGVPAYVAGVVAAMLTKSKKVGYLGGELIPPTTQSDDGFKAGVAATDPTISYSSTIVGNFNDPAKAKETAAAQIDSGVDVIFALLDAGFPGVEQAASASGKTILLMNPIVPRCTEGSNIVGTAVLSSANFVVDIVKEFTAKTMPQGQPKAFGIEDPNIQAYQLCPDWQKSDLVAAVKDATDKINGGQITLPSGV